VKALEAEPDRTFAIPDLVKITGATTTAVRKALSRLSKFGKGSGPIRRVSQGYYKFDSSKMQKNLQILAQSGDWKIENVVFVAKGAQGGFRSQSQTPESILNESRYDNPSEAHLKTGYPKTLFTGQQIHWEQYQNGTQVIRLSANGAPPFSPDSVLNILYFLEKDDFKELSWECKSIELNIDSRELRIDSSYSLQVMEGILLKAYQHGYNTRLEVAIRRDIPLREVMDVFHSIIERFDGTEALQRIDELERHLQQTDNTARLAHSIATKALEKSCIATGFMTGAEM
jgi:hypothetical protein